MLHNSLSRAAKKNMLQSCASMRRHHNEIGRDCLREPADFIEGRCATEHIAGGGRDAAFTCHLLELFERGLFANPLVCHEGKWDDRRRWCHNCLLYTSPSPRDS